MAKKLKHEEVGNDIKLAAGLVVSALLSDQGVQQMQNLLQGAKNPVMVVSHMIFMAITQVHHRLEAKGMDLDSRIWMAQGGVLDRVLVEVMTFLATALKWQIAGNGQFVNDVKETIIELMKKDDDTNTAARLLKKKGLPIPPQQPPQGQPDDGDDDDQSTQQPQGLAAPQQQMGQQ